MGAHLWWPPALAGLLAVAVMLSAGQCKEQLSSKSRSNAAGLKDHRPSLFHLILEILQELKKQPLEEEENSVQYKHNDFLDPPSREGGAGGRRAESTEKEEEEEQRVEIVPRDLRMKDKFLNHLTGHLYFGPKCTKHFHRLYHHTRDCTIPAYYKRCARLLTRLAVSPMCTEG